MSDYREKRDRELIDGFNRLQTSRDYQIRDDAIELRIHRLQLDGMSRADAEKYWTEIYTADQRRPFEEVARDRKLQEITARMIEGVADKVIPDDTIVIPETSGAAVRISDFPCGANPEHRYLTREARRKLVLGKYMRRGLMCDNKEELIKHLRAELLNSKTSYTVNCPECGNPSSYFRLMPVPEKA